MPLYYMDGNINAPAIQAIDSNNQAANSTSVQHMTNDAQIAGRSNDLSIATLYQPHQMRTNEYMHGVAAADMNATARILFPSNPSPNRIASCDNLTNQNVAIFNTNCNNFRLARTDTLNRPQCALDSRSNRIMQNQSFKSTPDLTSSNANIELPFAGIKCCNGIGRCALIAPNHPDVIRMNIYHQTSPAWLTLRNTDVRQRHPQYRPVHNNISFEQPIGE